MTLLEIEGLKVYYKTWEGWIKAVDGVNVSLEKGESLGLVGESGSGKSTLALALMNLLPPQAKIIEGKILFKGKDLTKIPDKEYRKVRGKEISMIFQDPMTSFNPLMRIGDHITEIITAHEKVDKKEAWERAEKLLEMVGIPKERAKDYPHQFSGGMRQRAMIAIALALNPDILIADEPTTALDVIVQAQILDLIKRLKEEMDMALLFISHDISVVMEVADKIGVMYAGHLVEVADTYSIAEEPLHPYTKGLIRSIPNILLSDQKLESIPGNPPDLANPPSGCRFHPRCPYATDRCRSEEPPLVKVGKSYVKCFLYKEEGER